MSALQLRIDELLREEQARDAVAAAAGGAAAVAARMTETEEEQTVAGEVWYEYINSDVSAIAVVLPSSSERMSESDGDRLVWRPGAGLDGWTPMREVLSQRASSDPSAVALAAEPSEIRGGASGPAVGTPYNVAKWRPQFGLPVEACETTCVNGYHIPSILVLLWRTLKANGGLAEEGVFRIAGEHDECKEIVAGLNTSGELLARIGRQTSAHNLANLIKMWFRLLPENAKLVTEDMIERILAEGELESDDLQVSSRRIASDCF